MMSLIGIALIGFLVLALSYEGTEGFESNDDVTKVSISNSSQLAPQSGYRRVWPVSSIFINPNPNNTFLLLSLATENTYFHFSLVISLYIEVITRVSNHSETCMFNLLHYKNVFLMKLGPVYTGDEIWVENCGGWGDWILWGSIWECGWWWWRWLFSANAQSRCWV